MKGLRLLIIFTIAITLGFMISPTFAQEKKEEAKPATMEKAEPAKAEKAKKPSVPSISGEVVSVDATSNTIVIKTKNGEEKKFEVNSETKITMEKKPMALQDLKAGEKVGVKYSETEGKMVAKSIKVRVPKASKAMPMAEEKKEPAMEKPAMAAPEKAEPEKK